LKKAQTIGLLEQQAASFRWSRIDFTWQTTSLQSELGHPNYWFRCCWVFPVLQQKELLISFKNPFLFPSFQVQKWPFLLIYTKIGYSWIKSNLQLLYLTKIEQVFTPSSFWSASWNLFLNLILELFKTFEVGKPQRFGFTAYFIKTILNSSQSLTLPSAVAFPKAYISFVLKTFGASNHDFCCTKIMNHGKSPWSPDLCYRPSLFWNRCCNPNHQSAKAGCGNSVRRYDFCNDWNYYWTGLLNAQGVTLASWCKLARSTRFCGIFSFNIPEKGLSDIFIWL